MVLGMIYRNIRGLLVDQSYVRELLTKSGHSELEWEKFFGETDWRMDGFAVHQLEQYVAIKEWILFKRRQQ